MSGIKDQNVSLFYRSLRARGVTITDLADSICGGRSHLSQVLSGKLKGTITWRRLIRKKALTPRELWLLGKGPEPVDDVPRATNSDMEHSTQEGQPWQATG